ncbi:MAG: hypothetical protein B7Z80_18130 [Rhodospirillales bacterium 20-64-7]|nr:MAG: hypothetical protein B7Z80_18130 [Rhodospirillales bacterium 20-64-7]
MSEPTAAANHEGELLRAFLRERVRAGADLRGLMLGHAALLGQMAVTAVDTGYLETMVELLTSTIRYNAILMGRPNGNA